MKFCDMTTDETMDILVDITPSVMEIVQDEELVKLFKDSIKPTKGMKKEEIQKMAMAKGIEKISKIIPMLLSNHRINIYNILSAINKKTVDEIKKQSPIITINEIKELFQDKDLINFFSQLNN